MIRIRLSAPHSFCTQFMSHLKICDPHKNHYHLLSSQHFVLPPALPLSPLMPIQNGSCRTGMMNLANQHLLKEGTAYENHRNSAIVAPKLGPKLDCSRHLGNPKRVCACTEHFQLAPVLTRKTETWQMQGKKYLNEELQYRDSVALKLAIYTTTCPCY